MYRRKNLESWKAAPGLAALLARAALFFFLPVEAQQVEPLTVPLPTRVPANSPKATPKSRARKN